MTTTAAPAKAPRRWPYVLCFVLLADAGGAFAWLSFRRSDSLGSTEAWAGGAAAVAGLAAGWFLGRRLWLRVEEEARARAANPNDFPPEPNRRQMVRMFVTYALFSLTLNLASSGPDVVTAAVMLGLCAACLGVALAVLAGRPRDAGAARTGGRA